MEKKLLEQLNDLSLNEITESTFDEVKLNENNEILLILDSNKYDKFIEGIGLFKDKLEQIKIEKHLGMFKDSILLIDHSNNLYDLRYYPNYGFIDFYNIDTNTKKLYLKNIGIAPLKILIPEDYTDQSNVLCETNNIVEIIFNKDNRVASEIHGIWSRK